MSEPRSRGTPLHGGAGLGEVVKALTKGLGDANLGERAVGHGTFKDGESVGARDSVYVMTPLSAAGVLTLPHNLRRVPKWVKVFESTVGNDGVGQALVSSHNKHLWTATTIQVKVAALAGSLAGIQLTLEVGG